MPRALTLAVTPAIVPIAATAIAPIALAVVPAFAGRYEVDLLSRIFVLAIFALSLELLVGQTGLVSLGHAAFMALGAYTTAFLLQAPGPRSFWLLVVAGMAAAAA